MNDIYRTPDAALNDQTVSGDYGSLQKGISGDYNFSIGDTISEAWERTRGAKGTFNLAFFIYFLVAIATMMVLQLVMIPFLPTQPTTDPTVFMIASIVQQVLLNLVLMPVIMGLFILGLRRSLDAPIEATNLFGYYHRALSLLGTLILMYIMLAIGYLLFIIPGIYLSVAYILAMPLVVEKNLSPWQALEASRKAISKRWFSVLGFMLVMAVILLISMLPFGLGLIWTAPMMMIAYGIMYRNMFGAESVTIN